MSSNDPKITSSPAYYYVENLKKLKDCQRPRKDATNAASLITDNYFPLHLVNTGIQFEPMVNV